MSRGIQSGAGWFWGGGGERASWGRLNRPSDAAGRLSGLFEGVWRCDKGLRRVLRAFAGRRER